MEMPLFHVYDRTSLAITPLGLSRRFVGDVHSPLYDFEFSSPDGLCIAEHSEFPGTNCTGLGTTFFYCCECKFEILDCFLVRGKEFGECVA